MQALFRRVDDAKRKAVARERAAERVVDVGVTCNKKCMVRRRDNYI